jgi:hypothetical protein
LPWGVDYSFNITTSFFNKNGRFLCRTNIYFDGLFKQDVFYFDFRESLILHLHAYKNRDVQMVFFLNGIQNQTEPFKISNLLKNANEKTKLSEKIKTN